MESEFTYSDILTEKNLKGIKNWKYKGKDNSLLYNYLLSPFAQYIVDNHTPDNFAYARS